MDWLRSMPKGSDSLNRGGNVMKKAVIIGVTLFVILLKCSTAPIPEPNQCSMCADLSRHALYVINLNTGEKLDLDIYEPHPFLVGEIAEKQYGGYFSLVRGAGIEGYKVGAEYIVVAVPIEANKMDLQYFCNACRVILEPHTHCGYALVDLKEPKKPVVYSIDNTTSLFIRCYSVLVEENVEKDKYVITIRGHHSE